MIKRSLRCYSRDFYTGENIMSKYIGAQMLEFAQKGDERGHLVIIEGMDDIPFDIKRIFYIYGSDKDVIRGQHANRESEFLLINVAGTSKVRIRDGKGNEAIFVLNRPHTGVYLPKMIWKDMYDFSEDSVLLCLSSEHYDPEEYIRDYNEFVGLVNKLEVC
jgi:dTDP-4-dehydrorhamnose 3,5-epimerase-like enzyme